MTDLRTVETTPLPSPDFRTELKLVDPELVRVVREREEQVREFMVKNHGINSADYKPYHGEDPLGNGHINRVAQRNVAIIETFFEAKGEPKTQEEAKEREEMLLFAHFIGTEHDSIQNRTFLLVTILDGKQHEQPIEGDWKQLIGKGQIKRKRAVGQNEEDTIREVIEWMDRVNEDRIKNGLPILFIEKHKGWLTRGVRVTVPGYAEGTVVQPNLEPTDSELTYSNAWGDLKGGIFMDGWEQFFKEGDLNLLEDNPDILEVSLHPDQYSTQVIEDIANRVRSWRGLQITFAEAQWNQLQKQTALFPKAAQLLRERNFREGVYQDTYQKIKQRVEQNKKANALELLAELKEHVLEEQRKYPKAA